MTWPLNAPVNEGGKKTFRITHPFHPDFGREFELERYHCAKDEDWVLSRNEDGCRITFPARWTDIIPPDPHYVVSKGKSLFRVEHLLELVRFIRESKGKKRRRPRKKPKSGV